MQLSITLADLLKVAVGSAGALGAAYAATLNFRKDKTAPRESAEAKAADHLDSLTERLMEERTAREGDVRKLQDRVTELFGQLEDMRRTVAEKDAIIAEQLQMLRAKDGRIEQLDGELRSAKQFVESAATLAKKGLPVVEGSRRQEGD